MEADFLKKAISEHLEAINEQFSVILSHEKMIPQIEIDITMDYVRKLYVYLRELEKENHAFPEKRITSRYIPEEKIKGDAFTVDDQPVADESKSPLSGQINKDGAGPREAEVVAEDGSTRDKPEMLSSGPGATDNDIIIPGNGSALNKKGKSGPVTETTPVSKDEEHTFQDLTTDSQPDKKPVIDLFSGGAKTLADKLVRDNEKRVADKIKENQLASLKSSIGINDKFLFINELFKGKLSEYNQAIKKIDECGSEGECLELIEEMKYQFEWKEDSDPFLRLKEFVDKKLQA